jgi:hypothetical protein
MKFGKLELNPTVNPAVLDTATWDRLAAWKVIEVSKFDWNLMPKDGAGGSEVLPSGPDFQLHAPSVAQSPGATFVLASLRDGQDVLIRIGDRDVGELAEPLGQKPLSSGGTLAAYPSDAAVLDRFFRKFKPAKGSRQLGATPRLGVGTRMTNSVWPGIFQAMNRRGFAANAIQNSVRELNLLELLLAGAPPEKNYSTGIGTIECGWTGSTYEGLWVAGVLAALKWNGALSYGADADHVQVKRGTDGLERARRVLRAARYYSFYTLDMADVLNYAALNEQSRTAAENFLSQKIPEHTERIEIREFHTRGFHLGTDELKLDVAAVGRFVGKYWDALAMLEELARYIATLKEESTFDLELTIDEHPPEVAAFDCLTTTEEVLFLAREIQRRRLPITHLAPNFGQEKGYDYRCPDGLEGLERRARAQFNIAENFGLMLDVHSGDDLTSAPRRVFQRATGGRLHFKVSPQLQLLYAELLQEFHPQLFNRWWQDAVSYAEREAANGSPIAQDCLAGLRSSANPTPSWRHAVFHYFSFPFVGRRDAQGQFMYRHEFYQLSDAFNRAYQQRICDYLCELAGDLF